MDFWKPRVLLILRAATAWGFSPAPPAHGDDALSYAFTGSVTAVDRGPPAASGHPRLVDRVEVGSAVSGWFAFPADAADIDLRPGRGAYEASTALGASFRLEVPGAEAGLAANDFGQARVRVEDGGPEGDAFRISFDDNWGAIAFEVELLDPSGTALAGDALPRSLDLVDFATARLTYQDRDRFAGTAATLVARLTGLQAPP